MSTRNLNMLTDPYIRVIDQQGHEKMIRPHEANEPGLQLFYESPEMEQGALLLLIAIFQTLCAPKSQSQWAKYLLERTDLSEELYAHKDVFNLYGDPDQPRALQVPPPRRDYVVEKGSKKAFEWYTLASPKSANRRLKHFGLDVYGRQEINPLLEDVPVLLYTLSVHAKGDKAYTCGQSSMFQQGNLFYLWAGEDLWSQIWYNVMLEDEMAGIWGQEEVPEFSLPWVDDSVEYDRALSYTSYHPLRSLWQPWRDWILEEPNASGRVEHILAKPWKEKVHQERKATDNAIGNMFFGKKGADPWQHPYAALCYFLDEDSRSEDKKASGCFKSMKASGFTWEGLSKSLYGNSDWRQLPSNVKFMKARAEHFGEELGPLWEEGKAAPIRVFGYSAGGPNSYIDGSVDLQVPFFVGGRWEYALKVSQKIRASTAGALNLLLESLATAFLQPRDAIKPSVALWEATYYRHERDVVRASQASNAQELQDIIDEYNDYLVNLCMKRFWSLTQGLETRTFKRNNTLVSIYTIQRRLKSKLNQLLDLPSSFMFLQHAEFTVSENCVIANREEIWDVVLPWWHRLQEGGNASRGRLRQCSTLEDVATVRGFYDVQVPLKALLGRHYSKERTALLVGCLSHLEHVGRERPGRAFSEKVSAARIGPILRLDDLSQVYVHLRGLLKLSGESIDVRTLILDMLTWGPKVRQQWAEDYYSAPINASDAEKSAEAA